MKVFRVSSDKEMDRFFSEYLIQSITLVAEDKESAIELIANEYLEGFCMLCG